MIKKTTIGIYIIFGLSLLFLGGYYLGCNRANQKQPKIIQNETILDHNTSDYVSIAPDPASVEAAAAEDTCKENAIYRLIEYNEDTREEKIITEPLPSKFVGLKRNEIEAELSLYLETPSLTDMEKGIVNCTLDTFSPNEMTVRKTYSNRQISNEFYLVAEKNYITVYRTDLETVYMYTGISLDSLDAVKREEILHCKYISGLSQLYDYLESCTS